ncbi:potassium transporter Kef [Cellulomonas sp. A375-1]|uniref:Potassium transporter Kef n=1 Tax=Cellulomonas gelida TaxID=1712 RepID=A0A4Y3KIJ8_9CELL|nr:MULTISPECIES: cation:proton antiporter family protein [Cellulomonas]KMM45306.1 potassium transporter Kef [Cellulomonas sp. A375-1]GEA84241.1 potassium transporter Kef [Cellulomonas gelida]GGL36793.1 potassium transporter Kef [Cellulomonas gelida]
MAAAALYLGAAVVGGLLAVLLRLPPLVGFLAAGFALGAGGAPELPYLEAIADFGVVLLLFAIGLKLDVRTLLRREIWLTSVVHMVLSVAMALGFLGLLTVVGFGLVADESFGALALVGFALSFSSTVFVVKVLDDRSDTTSLYGRIAIGVLVMQDVAAVVFLSMSSGEAPSPWALLLFLLIPGSWMLHRIWNRVGHGELQALFGVFVAVVLGYGLFELVGIDGDVGALVVGVLLASHPQAGELSRSLMTFKDLMLVAFFVQIGLHGTPHLLEVSLALLLLLLLPFQVAAYAVVLWFMRLRRRTSFLGGLVLSNYSEFGIIVVAVGASSGLLEEQWVVVVSLAVAFSFGLSAIVNRRGVELATRLSRLLPVRDSDRLHPEDRLVDIGDADALVLGLGRVGASTYSRLRDEYGLSVVGVEHDRTRVVALEDEGYEVVRADATDLEFWTRVQRAGRVKVAVLAMPFHNANLIALTRLQAAGFTGRVAAVARYDDDVAELERHGADAVFHLYGSAGFALADHAAEVLLPGRSGPPPAHPPASPGDELDVLDPLKPRDLPG